MSTQGVTNLMIKLSGGKREVLDELLPMIYDERKTIGAGYLRRDQTPMPPKQANKVRGIGRIVVKKTSRQYSIG